MKTKCHQDHFNFYFSNVTSHGTVLIPIGKLLWIEIHKKRKNLSAKEKCKEISFSTHVFRQRHIKSRNRINLIPMSAKVFGLGEEKENYPHIVVQWSFYKARENPKHP